MIHELHNPVTESYKQLQQLMTATDQNSEVDWYCRTPIVCDYDQPTFFSHCILGRGGASSRYLELAKYVVSELGLANGIRIDKFHRINVNYTTYCGDKFIPAHVDHVFPHKTMIVYLDAEHGGCTRVYKEKYNGSFVVDNNKLNVLDDFHPTTNSVMVVNGLNYHSNTGTRNPCGRRIVMVTTFEESEWQSNM